MNESMTALGILLGIQWSVEPDMCREIQKGVELVPNELVFRVLTEEDKKKLYDFPSKKRAVNYAVLEMKNVTFELIDDRFNPIRTALLSFRLLKPGKIFLECIYGIPNDSKEADFRYIEAPVPDIIPEFWDFRSENKNELVEILHSLLNVDFTKELWFRIACDRFERSYHNYHYEDSILDHCIAFEALYLKGQRASDKGLSIGLGCSMLLGQNNKERRRIYGDIKRVFKIRNDIVHGKPQKTERLDRLLPKLENYLRRSILRLIP